MAAVDQTEECPAHRGRHLRPDSSRHQARSGAADRARRHRRQWRCDPVDQRMDQTYPLDGCRARLASV